MLATRKRNVRADRNRGPPQWVVQPGLLLWDLAGFLFPRLDLDHVRKWWVGWGEDGKTFISSIG